MKKVLLAISVILGLAIALPVFAQEAIDSFNAQIRINSDSSISVTERILYNFGGEQRHGIFREVPIKYDTPKGNRSIRVNDINVTDESDVSLMFDVSNQGSKKVIKIGDPDVFVTGQKIYIISYTVEGALNYFKDYDELYWNVTGDEWPVEMQSVGAEVVVPSMVNITDLTFTCFVGIRGSTNPCQSSAADGTINFISARLLSGEGLTIVVGLPKGVVAEPGVWQKIIWAIRDNLILLLPILTFIGMWRLWKAHGKDPAGRGVIVPQYDPPKDLTPAEVGTIIDEKVNPKDTSATIIDLAVRGYLKIKRIEKSGLFGKADYELTRLKLGDDLQNKFEKEFFEKLFTTKKSESTLKKFAEMFAREPENKNMDIVKISDLKNSFYKTLQEVNKLIYESIVTKGYFTKSPNTIRGIYASIAFGTAFVGFVFGGSFGAYTVFGFLFSAIIVFVFGFFMPKKTEKGAQAKEYIEGLKQYLSVAEKDRIEFHNAPEKSPERFEKLLPYAMVLGVEQQWAKQFEDIYKQPPSWYEGRPGDVFTAAYLASSLSDFNTQANSVLASSPSSAAGGGSGFSGGGSGGGFGGGGGGSW